MDYQLKDTIAVITFDDGKANSVGPQFQADINAALDKAESEAAAVIITGRPGMFSAGFDLKEFEKGFEAGMAMAVGGFELLIRLYGLPLPLVAASTGHGIALGAFILMVCDSRIGAIGDYKYSLPETKIGMDLPPILVELTRSRLAPRYLTRAALQSENFGPELAAEAGFLDEAVDADELMSRAEAVAQTLAALPGKQYAANKLRLRGGIISEMKANLEKMKQELQP